MNKLILTPLFFVCSVTTYANNTISLKQAIAAHKVLIRAVGTGGYMGKSLKLNMVNLTCDPITVTVDPALIFKPADTNYQNLVVVGDENIDLQPDKETNVIVQTFCGKNSASCPRPGIKFNFWKQGDSILIKTVRYIKQNNFYNHLGQSAVWTVTNGTCISTIYDPEYPEISKDFIAFEADIRKLPVPGYYSYYQLDTTGYGASCVAAKGKQFVDLEYKDGIARHVYVIVLDDKGQLYNKRDIVEHIKDGNHTITLQFDDTKDKEGLYCVLLRNDNNEILSNKTVRVGMDWCY
jgi:hypothetical protein